MMQRNRRQPAQQAEQAPDAGGVGRDRAYVIEDDSHREAPYRESLTRGST